MRTIETKIYKFEELSEEAQQKAIENSNNINVDYQDWYDSVYENFKEETKEFQIDKMYFSGFWSQGDGAMFEYSNVSDELFYKAIDSLKISNWKKQLIKDNCFIYARGKQSGRYSHEKSCDHSIEIEKPFGSLYPNIENFLYESEEYITDYIIDHYETLARKLYGDLEESYNYLTSEESVKEALIGNDYEFSEDGSIYF